MAVVFFWCGIDLLMVITANVGFSPIFDGNVWVTMCVVPF